MIAVATTSIISCQKDDVYSCDPQVNRWAKSNISNIQSINVEKFRNFGEAEKSAMYRIFTPDQKYSLWKIKLQDVLTLNWNDNEKYHIHKLINFIESHKHNLFTKKMAEVEVEFLDKFDKFKYEWIEYAQENLQWSKKTIGSISYTANFVLNKEGDVEIFNSKTRTATTRETTLPTCDCSLTSSMTCMTSLGKDDCGESRCNIVIAGSFEGCGFMLKDNCNGLCY